MFDDVVKLLHTWESHVLRCEKCAAYDKHPRWLASEGPYPCPAGRAIIFNILKLLESNGH